MKVPKLKMMAVALITACACSTALADQFYLRVVSIGLRAPPSALPAPAYGSFPAISKYYGAADFQLQLPTSTSSAPITLSSADANVATLTGTSVHIVGVGTTTITASQTAAGGFDAGSISTTLTVLPGAPTLGSFAGRSGTVGSTFTLTPPTSNSSGAFSYVSSDPTVATVSAAGVVQVLKAGSTTITATQAAAGNYAQASASMTLTSTNPVQASLIGNGTSKAGACASGAVGCATFSRTGGTNLAAVTFSSDNLTISHNPDGSGLAEVYFSVTPYSGKAYLEFDVDPSTTNQMVIGTCAVALNPAYGRNFEVLLDYSAQTFTIHSNGANVYANKPMCMNSKQGYVSLTGVVNANFGQSNFRQAVPSGYRAGVF